VANPTKPSSESDKSLTTLVSELWALVLRYAKQETLDPLKTLGRYLAAGVAGALALSIGLVLLALALLRALQRETGPHLEGNWSWAPYLIVVAVAAVLLALLARAIGAEKRRAERNRADLRKRG
jgi:MFS family permease